MSHLFCWLTQLGGRKFDYEVNDYEAFVPEEDVKKIAKSLNSIFEDFDHQWEIRREYLIEDGTVRDYIDKDEIYDILSYLLEFYQDAVEHGSAVQISYC
jgi:hypothetical protein